MKAYHSLKYPLFRSKAKCSLSCMVESTGKIAIVMPGRFMCLWVDMETRISNATIATVHDLQFAHFHPGL